MPAALLSCYDKNGIADFARQLYKWNWDLFASGGTARAIADAGIHVQNVKHLVGGGAILGHRVVTLSRKVHAGLLAARTEADLQELRELNIPFIDLVYVSLYPLVETLQDPNATLVDVTEKTDIGGPAMLRAAAKGRRLVITNPLDANRVLTVLKQFEGSPEHVDQIFLRELASRAEDLCSSYTIASTAALCTDPKRRAMYCSAYEMITSQRLEISANV